MLTNTHRRVQMILKGKLNNKQIARLTDSSRTTVRVWRKKLEDCNLSCEDIAQLSENDVRRLVAPGAFRRKNEYAQPNTDQILFEIQERGVRLKALYKDYCDGVAKDERPMGRSTFYRVINDMAETSNVTLSFEYEAGEVIQMDFVGRKRLKQPLLIDANGVEQDYELFCAASAKSRKIFVRAVESQAKIPVLDAFVKMFAFFGGVPTLVTIDNFKAAVSKARNGANDAVISPEFAAMADHYQFAFSVARVRKPRDKGIVEGAVGIAQDDVLAPLRNRRFFSLAEMNAAIRPLVDALNDRPMAGHGNASRNELFARADAPGYQPLPATTYEPGHYSLDLRVGQDYHVFVGGTRYSVPWRFAKEFVNAKYTAHSIHIFHKGRIIATHPRRDHAEHLVTSPDHMPPAHAAALQTRLFGIKRAVASIGPNAEALIDKHFRTGRRPAASARAAVILQELAKRYSSERVEAACAIALKVSKANTLKVEAILAGGIDNVAPDNPATTLPSPTRNVRGSAYFADLMKPKGADHV